MVLLKTTERCHSSSHPPIWAKGLTRASSCQIPQPRSAVLGILQLSSTNKEPIAISTLFSRGQQVRID